MQPLILLAIVFALLILPFGWWTALRLGLAAMFLLTASAHWGRRRADLIRMVPPIFSRPDLLVTLTGICEILGAIGLLIPKVAPFAAIGLSLFLIAVFPANVRAARDGIAIAGRRARGGFRMKLDDHPTVRNLAKVQKPENRHAEKTLDSAWLRRLALDRGAHDAGCVEIGRAALEPQRGEILRNYPWTKSLLSFVVRMAREPVRGAPRSVANLEFHRAGHDVDAISAAIVADLETRGFRAVN